MQSGSENMFEMTLKVLRHNLEVAEEHGDEEEAREYRAKIDYVLLWTKSRFTYADREDMDDD